MNGGRHPFFSIIIPCYNSARYLRDTLHSISIQSFQDFEVILVDDNSSDRSFEVAGILINEYRLRGQVIRKPIALKRGVSSTRNFAVKQSAGDWLCFLDSDDLFQKSKLETVSHFIERNSGIDFFHHSTIRINEDDEKFDVTSTYLPDNNFVSESIYDDNFVVTSTVVVNRGIFFELGGFDEDLNGVEDYNLWLKIFSNKNVLFIPQALGFYRTRAVSLMSGRTLMYYVNQNTYFLKKLSFLSPDQFSSVEAYMIYRLMNYYCNISLSRYGYFSLIRGLGLLLLRGYPSCAIKLLFIKSKNHLLFKLFKR